MDYKHILQKTMTSVSNIDTIMEVVLKNFKINQKAIQKCKIIIAEIINKYLSALQNYPSNNDQLIYAVKYLNESCYHEFEKYLNEKYPGMNIKKVYEPVVTYAPKAPFSRDEPVIAHTLKAPFSQDDFENKSLIDIPKISPRNIELIETPYATPKTSPITSEKEFVPRIQSTTEAPKMIIITEAEKNALLKAQIPTEQKSPDIFSQLTNPLMWQMIEIIMNLKKQQEYSAIYTSAEVKEMLDTVKTQVIEPSTVTKTVAATNIDAIKPTKLNDLKKTLPKIKSDEIDISKGLTKEDLPIVEKKIAALIEQKNKLLEENNLNEIEKVDAEKNQIIKAVMTYKKTLEESVKESDNKIKNVTITSTDNDTEDLNLKIDPSQDHSNLKNIVIKSKTDRKITEITLVDYFIPFNENNITRFNNKFAVYFNGKTTRVIIPPMKYDISTLIDFLKSQITFLDFTVNDSIVTITNTLEMEFDLTIDDDTIFQALGFNKRSNDYQSKKSYSGSIPFNINGNEKVLFSLSGTPMEPMLMEFNKISTVNKVLRSVKNGVTLRQLKLSFMNGDNQYYDFMESFNVHLQIKYLPEKN